MKRALLILLALTTWAGSWTEVGINIRNTSNGVTDSTNETYSLGGAYPETRGGATFGWATSATSYSSDRSCVGGIDHRLFGFVYGTNASTQRTFKLDAPAGSYQLRLAAGDCEGSKEIYVYIYDSTTIIDSVVGATATNEFRDATGALRDKSTWVTSNAAKSITLTHTQLQLKIASTAGTGFAVLNYVYLKQAGASTAVLTMANGGNGSMTPVAAGGDTTVPVSTPINITATPNTCYLFDHWGNTGGATVANVNNASTTVSLTANGTVTANFSIIQSILVKKPGIVGVH
jgi:hypothetical protein